MLPEIQSAPEELQLIVAHGSVMGCLSASHVGSVIVVFVPSATQPRPVMAPWAAPFAKVTTLPALPLAAAPPPVFGFPAVPPVWVMPPEPGGPPWPVICPKS